MCRTSLTFLFLGLTATAATSAEPAKATKVPVELLKARLEAVRQVFQAAKLERESGNGRFEELPLWSQRLLEAERALATTKKEQVTACREHLQRLREFERVQKARFEEGRIAIKEYAAAKYFRIEAEILLAQVEDAK